MKLKSILWYFVTLILAIALLLYVFRDIDLKVLWAKLKAANFAYVYISIAMSLVSHYFRGYRWTLLLKPLGYRLNSFRAFIAVMVGYFANLLVPRMGEVTRCAILKKTDNIPMPASLGSVISERLLDLILLLFIIVATFIIEFSTLKDFLYEQLHSAYKSFDLGNFLIGAGLVALIFVTGIYLISRNKAFIRTLGFYKKLRPFAYELINGLNSIRKLENKSAFFISTLIIWGLYYTMSYIIVFSFPATSNLGLAAGLSILMAGGLGMTAPVQSGIGTYHAFVSGVLILYGIGKEDGLLFATLVHTSQFISLMFFGGLSFLISFFLKKDPYGNEKQNITPGGSTPGN
ncbi:MAG: flippase-like domain-containing protein [Cyclobacteriaceae bacterium]|nr:flippase-like domain-containing protein [Cyclobacteriaceae bacterium]